MIDMQEAAGIDHLQWYLDLWDEESNYKEGCKENLSHDQVNDEKDCKETFSHDNQQRISSNNG